MADATIRTDRTTDRRSALRSWRRRWARTLVAGSLAAGSLAGGTSAAATTEQQQADCPTPPIAQALARKAVRTESSTRPDGRKVTRFYQAEPSITPVSAMQGGGVVAIGGVIAETPHYSEGGYEWYVRGNPYVNWLQSYPDCTQPDGYAFGFNVVCYRGPPPDGYPRTQVTCNWDADPAPDEDEGVWAALEFDYAGNHDFDAVWGYKQYHPGNQAACADSGGYHFISDSAFGELRTWIRNKVVFVSIGHPSQPRKTTSYHIELPYDGSQHAGAGVADWLSSPTNPGGSSGVC